uniref:Uncharacterized protein n=1 Tax=Gasterosteus aculeatus TaxID=69293 RepID=G3Q4J9_GASAC
AVNGSSFELQLFEVVSKNAHKPQVLFNLVTPYCPTSQLRSIDAGLLVVPMVLKSRLGARAFSYQAPLLWNQVPLSVRGADSVSSFSRLLKHDFQNSAS